MKAMYINAPGEVEIKEIDMPVRKEGEVLLKLLYGGICGSDLGSYRGTFAYLIIREFRDTNFQPKSLRQMRTMNMGSNRE